MKCLSAVVVVEAGTEVVLAETEVVEAVALLSS